MGGKISIACERLLHLLQDLHEVHKDISVILFLIISFEASGRLKCPCWYFVNYKRIKQLKIGNSSFYSCITFSVIDCEIPDIY